jgi:GTP-binding protein HflX
MCATCPIRTTLRNLQTSCASLSDLGIDEKEREARIIEVWNKIDRLDPEAHDAMAERASGRDNIMAVSAITGEGVDALLAEIARRLSGVLTETTVAIPADKLALVSWVYENAIVDERRDQEDGSVELDVRLSESQRQRSSAGSAMAPSPRRKTGSGSPQRCRPRLRLHSETRYSWVGGAP